VLSVQAALRDHLQFLRRDRADDARVRPGARYGNVNDSAALKVNTSEIGGSSCPFFVLCNRLRLPNLSQVGIIWPNSFSAEAGHVLIMDGVTVATALLHAPDLMRELCCACSAILCCRLSPIQKALIVRLVKNQKHEGVSATEMLGACVFFESKMCIVCAGSAHVQDVESEIDFFINTLSLTLLQDLWFCAQRPRDSSHRRRCERRGHDPRGPCRRGTEPVQ
jgi:hypothetical protein